MADSKLSDLSAAASLATTDLFYVVKTAGSGGVKATLSQLNTLFATLGANTFTSTQTITSGTITADAPVLNATQTWNNAAVTFTAIKLNVTASASGASSLLLDLQVGGATKMRVTKDGYIQFVPGSSSPSIGFVGASPASLGVFNAALTDYADLWTSSNYVKGVLSASDHLSLSSSHGTDGDTRLYRDTAYTLAQRNGANAQTLRVYGTYTDASNYERLALKTTAGSQVELAAETAGTGGDNLDVVLTPAGTGNVKFGTYTTLGTEALAGYITIKDAAGNTRKLAVIA